MDSTSLSSELKDDHRWLIRLSRRLLRDPEAAEDLAQEAALLALKSPNLKNSPTRLHVRSWLAKTAQHLAWNRNRQARHESFGISKLARESRGRETTSAAELAERAEFRAAVALLVSELPPLEREVVVLRFYDDLSVAKIQEALGAPSPEAVRKRLSRGIQRLRAALDERYGGATWQPAALLVTAGVGAKKASARAFALAPLCLVGIGAWTWLGPSGESPGPSVPAVLEPSAGVAGVSSGTDRAGSKRLGASTA